jgi:hypothetical protein
MRRYTLVSGVFFALLTGVQVLRFLRKWPVRVGDVDIPVWASGIAALIAFSLAFWAFRSVARSDSRPAM